MIVRQFKLLPLARSILFATRNSHQNHPGHKQPKKFYPRRYELPDLYSEEAYYPPVKPEYPPNGHWSKLEPSLAWRYYNDGVKFHTLKTIQERLTVLAYMNIQSTLDDIGLRRIRHYPIFQLSAMPPAVDSLKFRQYITNTHLAIKKNYDEFSQKDENLGINGEFLTNSVPSVNQETYDKIKESIVNSIKINLFHKENSNENPLQGFEDKENYTPRSIQFKNELKNLTKKNQELSNDILNSIISILASQNETLRNAHYGQNVSVQGYWMRCGYKETKARGAVYPDPDTIRFQFNDKALYQVKTDLPLRPLFRIDDSKYEKLEVPQHNYAPKVFKTFADHTLPMQVPGHWYGDKREFNLLTVYDTTKTLELKNRYNLDNDYVDDIRSMAVTCGHAELTAQAYYLGFSQWKDLTYPLFGQFLFTNGQDYFFSKYQLNSLQSWNPSIPTKNICLISEKQRLFELNEAGNDIASFNDSVLKNLIQVLSQQPIKNTSELVHNFDQLNYMIGGTPLRPFLAINDFEAQLSMRRKLLAISLYELVKYDKPVTYLDVINESLPKGDKPKFDAQYNRLTYKYRDIVLNFYPRDFHGFELVKISLQKNRAIKEKYWDYLDPVHEWAQVPPPHTNNITRNINLPIY